MKMPNIRLCCQWEKLCAAGSRTSSGKQARTHARRASKAVTYKPLVQTGRPVLKSKWRANSLTQLISNLIEPVRLVLVSYTRGPDSGFVVTSDLCVVLRVFLWGGHHFPPRRWPTNKHDFKARHLSDIVATRKSRWPYSLLINYRICPTLGKH